MSYDLGPINTADNYTTAATVETQDCSLINFFVSNAPILYELLTEQGWSQERYIPSAANSTTFASYKRKCSGVRIRSAVAGTPATVYIELIPASERGN